MEIGIHTGVMRKPNTGEFYIPCLVFGVQNDGRPGTPTFTKKLLGNFSTSTGLRDLFLGLDLDFGIFLSSKSAG